MELKRFEHLLACPDCRCRLERGEEDYGCGSCGQRFPRVGNVPVLYPAGGMPEDLRERLESGEGQRMQEEYARMAPHGGSGGQGPRAWLGGLRTQINNFPDPEIDKMTRIRGDDTLILSVGGGPTRNNEKEINLNIGLFPNVDLVGDGAALPLVDGAVDGVWCNAVLEHVADPWGVAREIARVVRPGGHVFIYQPFLQPYHAYPSDYWRFTLDGVRRLFPDFEEVCTGSGVGPTCALLHLGDMYLRSYLPHFPGGRNIWVSRFVNTCYALFCWPWKRLDRRINRHANATELASVVYFLGRRREAGAEGRA